MVGVGGLCCLRVSIALYFAVEINLTSTILNSHIPSDNLNWETSLGDLSMTTPPFNIGFRKTTIQLDTQNENAELQLRPLAPFTNMDLL